MQKKGVYDLDYYQKRKSNKSFAYRLKRRTDKVLNSILKFKGKNINSLLDVGTADGIMLDELNTKLKIFHSFGFDISKELLKVNKKKQPMLCADALNQPFIDGCFDVVVASALIEHVPDPERAIKEFNRVLFKNGICVITTPNPFFEKIGLKIGYLKEKEHINTFSIFKIKKILESSGFEVIKSRKFLSSPVKILFAEQIDNILSKLGITFLMTNQLIVARKIS